MALLRRGRSASLTALAEAAAVSEPTRALGRRAAALAEAQRFGVPIPPTFVLPVGAFEEALRAALPPAHDPGSLLKLVDRPVGVERAARARELVLEAALLPALAVELSSWWRQDGVHARWGLLVAASPTCIDDTVARLAGLDLAVRGVHGERDLVDAVRRVWSSAFAEAALRVLRAHQVRELSMGVVIQLLDVVAAHGRLLVQRSSLPSPVASEEREPGAPVSGTGTVALATCALGLSTPVTDGTSANDSVRLTDDGRVIQTEIAAKAQALVVTGNGPELRDTEPGEASRFALSPDASAHLWQLADELDRLGAGPLAADYLVTAGGAVQAAALYRATGHATVTGGLAESVWSRVALADELPAAITPLTGSVLSRLAERSLHAAFGEIGSRLPRGGMAVQQIWSRPYLNLSVLVGALGRVPGVDPRGWLGGVGGAAADELQRQLGGQRLQRSLLRLPLAAARLFMAQRRLEARVNRWERDLELQRRWLAELDLAILPDDALAATLREASDRCDRTLALWLQSTLELLVARLLLRQVIARSASPGAERMARAVTSGVGSLASAEPGAALLEVMAVVRQDAAARRALQEQPLGEIAGLPHGPARRALAGFVGEFGYRGMREAELMSPRWAERPLPLLRMIAAGVHHESLDSEAALSYVRVQADAALADLEARLPLVDSALMRALALRVRALVGLRERLRTAAVQALSVVRAVALDVGRRLQRLDPTLQPESVFFATLGELVQAMSELRGELGPVTRLRRAEFERDAARPEPAGSFVGLPPHVEPAPRRGAVWHGVPCCGGLVAGRARIVGPGASGAERIRPGDILVVRTADVGLSPLFLMAAGIVAEVGTPSASGSVVAREYGVPLVTGATGVTRAVRDGDRLRVDGDQGLVEWMAT